jgi:hypothetical protein
MIENRRKIAPQLSVEKKLHFFTTDERNATQQWFYEVQKPVPK